MRGKQRYESKLQPILNKINILSFDYGMVRQSSVYRVPPKQWSRKCSNSLQDFSIFFPSSTVIVHWELFEARQALDWLLSMFSEMFVNLLQKNSGLPLRIASDLTTCKKIHLAVDPDFVMPIDGRTRKYETLQRLLCCQWWQIKWQGWSIWLHLEPTYAVWCTDD